MNNGTSVAFSVYSQTARSRSAQPAVANPLSKDIPMKSNADIDALVNSFAADLSLMVRRMALEQVMQALGGDVAAPARRGPGRPKGSTNAAPAAPKVMGKRGGKRIRRSAEDLAGMSDALLAHVKANPGQRGEQIAAALGTDVGTMRKPMKLLIAKKLVKTAGQRRGMTYTAGGAPAAKAAPKVAKAKRGKGKK